jgi:glucose/arabinose dehydrogenase
MVALFLILTAFDANAKLFNSQSQIFKTEILSEQKDVVWGFDFLSRDKIVFTERKGKIKILNLKTKAVTELTPVPEVHAHGEGGLLDIRSAGSDKIFFSYAEPVKERATTTLASAVISGNKLIDFKKIFSANPPAEGHSHFGSRIEFDGNHYLYLSIGDRNLRPEVQNQHSDLGKILRFSLKDEKMQPEIWAYGFRNTQGLAFDSTGQLWSSDLGPEGGDEINIVEKGKNYGWPEVTYGREYSGLPIGSETKEGVTPPVVYWVPSISPSAVAFYTGDKLTGWKNNLFVCALSGQHLRRLVIRNNKVTAQEELMNLENERFRNVRTGPDGYLYYSTDSGILGRIVPAK